jgi:hypothetical protein
MQFHLSEKAELALGALVSMHVVALVRHTM